MTPNNELPPEEQDWHRFQHLSYLGNHWQRPGWAEGRRSYHWLLRFEHAPGLHALAAQCQASFRDHPQFDLVPLDGLHLTLQRVAFTDEMPVSSLPAVLAAVKQRCHDMPPFQLRIGWLAGSTGAIRFTALTHRTHLRSTCDDCDTSERLRYIRAYACVRIGGVLAARQHCLQQQHPAGRTSHNPGRSLATLATSRSTCHERGASGAKKGWAGVSVGGGGDS